MKTAIVGGQLARRLGLPYRSFNAISAHSLDAREAFEGVFSEGDATMGGVELQMHGAGRKGGSQASFETRVLGADLLAMVAEFLKPMRIDTEELAFEVIREVDPGSHSFGAVPARSRDRESSLALRSFAGRDFESWREAVALTDF